MDLNIISITASSVGSPQSYPLRNLADFENRTYFSTRNEANSWICYDFKDMRVKLTHYSLRATREGSTCFLQSWILDGSVDGKSWVEMDRHEKDSSLNHREAIATFNIASSSNYRYIRLCQIGPTTRGDHYLLLNSIEFFGILTTPKH
jgi:hypothetical protein